jgi:hypothetical protein
VNGHRDRSDNSLRDRWKLRAVSEELTAHYVSEGWWDSRSLG